MEKSHSTAKLIGVCGCGSGPGLTSRLRPAERFICQKGIIFFKSSFHQFSISKLPPVYQGDWLNQKAFIPIFNRCFYARSPLWTLAAIPILSGSMRWSLSSFVPHPHHIKYFDKFTVSTSGCWNPDTYPPRPAVGARRRTLHQAHRARYLLLQWQCL